MLLVPHSAMRIYRGIIKDLATLGVSASVTDAQIWAIANAGAVNNPKSCYAVFTNPAAATKFRIDCRCAKTGQNAVVDWGDGTALETIALNTTSNTAISRTWGSAAARTIIVVGNITRLESAYATGETTFGGSVAGLTSLTYLSLAGSNTCTGPITDLPLEVISILGSNTCSGLITGKVSITYLYIGGLCTISGSITGMALLQNLYLLGFNTCSGVFDGMAVITSIDVRGSNTVSGTLAGRNGLTAIYLGGNNTVTGIEAVSATASGLGSLTHAAGTSLNDAQVNAVLAGFWLNRNNTKSISARNIILNKSGNAAPTGQGLLDAAALRLYRSPTPPGTAALWTVTTN